MSVIAANNLRKRYRDVHALDGLSFNVEPGQITGLIGPNGSGKTTAINAILGLNTLDSGELSVLGMNPATQRAQLMTQVAYIADTGILPKWMKVKDMLDFVGRVQPTFNREVAEAHLAKTDIRANKTIQTLSKGMHVQLHLAVVLAIDAPLLVLDEPTLGLDVLYRQRFYDAILNDYFTTERSILVTTHEVREIEHILTNVVLIDRGRGALVMDMQDAGTRYLKLTCGENVQLPAHPVSKRKSLQGTEYIFDGVPRELLEPLGPVSKPNLVELFVAVVGDASANGVAGE